jgi:hypothetical protein
VCRWTAVTCLDDQYLHISTCHDWDESWKLCTGAGNENCTECNKGYHMNNGKCVSLLRIFIN